MGSSCSSGRTQPLGPQGADDAPSGTSQSLDQQHGKTVRQCITFLKTNTATGGRTVRCSPSDPTVFAKTAGKRDDLRPEFLKSVKRLHATENYTEDSALENLLTVCKMSDLTDTVLADELVQQGYSKLFLKIWKAVYHADMYTSVAMHRQYIAYNLLKQATISFTHVSWKLCAEMGSAKYGIVPLMAREFEHPLMTPEGLKTGVKRALWDSPRETLKKMINILANIIRMNLDSKPVFRQANIVPHLQNLLKCRFLIMRAKALFCLVYLINEDENEALSTTDDNIDFVIKVLGRCLEGSGHFSEHYTYSAEVVVQGILNLGLNDSNKVKLVKKGVLPKLITMLKTESLSEKQAAARAVWKLAFHEENKETFKADTTLITVLKQVQSSETDHRTLQACDTVLWMLGVGTREGKGPGDSGPPTEQRGLTAKKSGIGTSERPSDDVEVQSLNGDNLDDEMPHVMISYQWGVQKQMIKVKELLRAAGYNVWMDVDNMGDSTLESMAAAVERSAVVLICFTEKYKRSASCRTEAEYTYKLQKSIIPLRLQEDYNPDGWLGIMIGTKLYVDLSGSATAVLKEGVDKLKQQLGERGRVLKDTQMEAVEPVDDNQNFTRGASTRRSTQYKVPAASRLTTEAKAVSSWNNDQVNAWLTKQGLGGLKSRFDGYNGQRLLGLKTIATEAPDFFFSELKKDLGFQSLLEIVTFKQALDDIL